MEPPKKILVRVCNWIGDVVMNIPAVEVLRRAYPDAEIVALHRPWVKDVLRFRPDLFDRSLPFDDKGELRSPRAFFRFCRELRRERFDLAVVFTKHIKGALASRIAGIPVRVGIGTSATSLFLNRKIAYAKFPKGRHQSANYLDLTGLIGVPHPDRLAPRLERDESLEAESAAAFLEGLPKPLLTVHAGAAFGTAKRWFPERYAEVCRRFAESRGGSVVLLGVGSEKEVNRDIALTAHHPHVRDLCGMTSLAQSIALISQSDAFLSNDSGLMHVAAAFGLPQAAIFGPTDIEATFPFNDAAETLYHKVDCSPCFKRHCPIGHDCMKAVTVDEVDGALASLRL